MKIVLSLLLISVLVTALAACSTLLGDVLDLTFQEEQGEQSERSNETEEKSDTRQAEEGTKQRTADPDKPQMAEVDPSIVGSWIDNDYDGKGRSALLVFSLQSDGSFIYVAFNEADGSGEPYEGTMVYLEQWVDDQGRLCGRSTVTLNSGMSWETLDRLSVDQQTLEVQSGVRKINPNGPRYSVYYRP